MRRLRPEGHEECDVRIRELEAELAESRMRTIDQASEKATIEEALLEWHRLSGFAEPQELRRAWEELAEERDVLEVRVAELELRLASANKAIEAMLREGEEGARIRAYLETGDASLIGAREREAD